MAARSLVVRLLIKMPLSRMGLVTQAESTYLPNEGCHLDPKLTSQRKRAVWKPVGRFTVVYEAQVVGGTLVHVPKRTLRRRGPQKRKPNAPP
jgi:hypothetical protein